MMKRVLYGRVLSLDCRSSRIENALLSQIKAGGKARCQCVIEGIARGRSSSNPHNFGCYLTKSRKQLKKLKHLGEYSKVFLFLSTFYLHIPYNFFFLYTDLDGFLGFCSNIFNL